jgi:hypothetical protein
VWDGNQYYYFFGPRASFNTTGTNPPANWHDESRVDQGVRTISRAGVTIIDWNPADGGAKRETFSDARQGNMKLHGTSNRYAPMVAAKIT